MTDEKSGRGLSAGGFYFAERDQIGKDSLRLPPDEARHALRVMRLEAGDEIAVVDGEGGWYRARIMTVDRSGLLASIEERKQDVGEPSYKLTVAIGLVRQQGRFETFLEKAVELGVTRIVPTVTERSRQTGLSMQRCRRILIAGLKQSLRSRLPQLTELRPFKSVIRENAAVRFIAHETASDEESVLGHVEALRAADSCHVLVGPEGGFTDAEIECAERAGWIKVSLGNSRLRSETAGIAAAAIVQLIKSAGRLT